MKTNRQLMMKRKQELDGDDGENDESGDDYTEEEAMTGADED